MKAELFEDQIKVTGSGIKLLALKARLNKIIGGQAISKAGAVLFPRSALASVSHLLSSELEKSSVLNDGVASFDDHRDARPLALARVEGDSHVDLPKNWVEILDPPQASAVSAMVTPSLLGLCLFDEQGSGKTVMTIAAFDILKQRGDVEAMIVVCPKSMVNEWPADITKFLPEKYNVTVAEGNRNQKYQDAFSDFDVLVTNYEGVGAMLMPLLSKLRQKRILLVIDESYYLKNEDSVRSEYAGRLREGCKKCFVLCGTPAPNSAHDLINQFNLADLGYTFGGFKKSSAPSDDWEKISSLVDSRGVLIRRLKEDILSHVPEKQFHVHRVALEGKQAVMYERARHELELTLRQLDNQTFRKSLASYFQRRAALLQICSSPELLDPTITEPSIKFKILDELLNDLISKGRKVVLWSFYKQSLLAIESRYPQYRPVRVDGSVKASERREAVRAFQADPTRMLFIGNPAAAGAGITLHASYDAIYYSYSNQAAHYLQSLDRIHRRGQISDEVNYHLLVCEGTIEETEIIRLRGKEIQQHSLLGDHIKWPSGLDDALAELNT